MVVEVLDVESLRVVVLVQEVLRVEPVLALPVVPYLHRGHLQVIHDQRSAGSTCGRCVVV